MICLCINCSVTLITLCTAAFLVSSFLFSVILFSVRLCKHYIFEFWFFPPNYESLSFNGIIWSIYIILQGMTFGKVLLLFSQTILPIFFSKFWGQKLLEKNNLFVCLSIAIVHACSPCLQDILRCDSWGLLILLFSCLLTHFQKWTHIVWGCCSMWHHWPYIERMREIYKIKMSIR